MLTPNASCTLYLQTGPGAYTRVYVPACFWQDGEDGVSIVIPGELPEQYKGEKREKDYVVQGERMGEVTDTQSKRELIADKPLTVKNLVHCAFGGLPHCEVTTEWCCTIKVDIENSKGQYIEKDKQEATKDGSESTKIQHGI